MSELTLLSDISQDTTSLSNIYIDEYMSANNESQIKIYLYLLRNLQKGAKVSVVTIADTFNYSVTDVERALMYMEKQGLMGLKTENGSITGLKLLPLKLKRGESFKETSQTENLRLMEMPGQAKESKQEVPKKPEYSAGEVSEFTKRQNIEELMFVVQQYIGKPLSAQDVKSIMYIHEVLSFDTDVIEYLVEQSVESGKKSFRYMEKVAVSWYEEGVRTLEDVKALSGSIPKEVYEVFDAFLIKAGARKPSYKETAFVRKWIRDFGFSTDIIRKACEITIDRTHTVSFEYADATLNDWFKKGVKTISDIDTLLSEKKQPASGKPQKKQTKSFTGRDYDFDMLEKELLLK